MRAAANILLGLALFVASSALAAGILYGFWVCGFVGVLLKDRWLMAGAVVLWLLVTYLVFYRLRRL